MDIDAVLSHIGLTDGERRVYQALLELGESTSGPIAENSGVSASKVYQVIDRLMEKGLVGESQIRGTKHFRATHPRALLDYLREKERHVMQLQKDTERIMPLLEQQYAAKEQETEVHMYRGRKSFVNVLNRMLEELSAGEQYHVIGANYGFLEWTPTFFKHFHDERARKQIGARLLFQRSLGMPAVNMRNAKGKPLPETFANALQINIWKDHTNLLLMQEEPILFDIKSKQVAESFQQYFDNLWDQEMETLKGLEAAKQVMLQAVEHDEFLVIGGGGYIADRLSGWFENAYVPLAVKKGHKWRNLVLPKARNHRVTQLPFAETKVLPPGEYMPAVMWIFGDTVVHVIWDKEPLFFMLHNANVAAAHRRYFDALWKQESLTMKGDEAISLLVDDVLASNKDLYLIGATGDIVYRYPEEYRRLVLHLQENNLKRHQLVQQAKEGDTFTREGPVVTHYLPEHLFSPLVIWVYGDKVAHVLWQQELLIFVLENKQVADDYRAYFSMLKKSGRKDAFKPTPVKR